MDIQHRRQEYKAICENFEGIPVFLQYWWLDSISNNWDIVIYRKNEVIQGLFVFETRYKYGIKIISTPRLTPYSGLWLFYPEGQKNHSRISFENEVVRNIILQLPKSHIFRVKLFHKLKNGLQFRWLGFKESMHYSYRLDQELGDLAFDNFKPNLKRDIKKFDSSRIVIESDDVDTLFDINNSSFAAKKMKPNFSLNELKKIYSSGKKRDAATILLIHDTNTKKVLGGLLLIKDTFNRTAYYLLGSTYPESRDRGTQSCLLWKAIQYCFSNGLNFDFEGSVIPSIEKYFRAFNPEQYKYSIISKQKGLGKLLEFLSI